MFEWRGLEELDAALDRMAAALTEANAAAAGEGGHLIANEAQRLLGLRSHARGTPTPSAPGQPPARISGALQDSIHVEGPVQAGTIASVWVFGTEVYAAIHETGGVTGRGHRTHLPPRPYLRPALDKVTPQLLQLLITAWGEALHGV